MSAQESIAAALEAHALADWIIEDDLGWSCHGCGWRSTCPPEIGHSAHLAAVAMDAARAAVEALHDVPGTVDCVDRAAVLDLLTPGDDITKENQ